MSLNQLRFAQHTAGHDAETPKHARSVKTRPISDLPPERLGAWDY